MWYGDPPPPPPPPLPLPANQNDVDPISLEPVESLRVWFELRWAGKTYRYDAWAWLEMCTRETTDRYVHPLFDSPITIVDRRRCWEACVQDATVPRTPHQLKLLEQCKSTRVRHTCIRNSNGHLCRLHLFVESPLLDLVIDVDQSWCKWTPGSVDKPNIKPAWTTGFNCEAAIKYTLVDADQVVQHSRKLWM